MKSSDTEHAAQFKNPIITQDFKSGITTGGGIDSVWARRTQIEQPITDIVDNHIHFMRKDSRGTRIA